MFNPQNNALPSEPVTEKAICTFSYVTLGIGGFLYLLLTRSRSYFVRYHIYQSLIFGIVLLLLHAAFDVMFDLLNALLGIFGIGAAALHFVKTAEQFIIHTISVLTIGLITYCIISTWRNNYTWIKYISPQVKRMM